ncbi:MAG TPA: glycoside hydrolase family 15 protein [Pyrinomonadaceae bacterium]|nr:glycoside hydrolase family 15 protein [Pyrinomonadaceae bacterium]
MLCWVALDRAIKLGIHRYDKKRFTGWLRTRDEIREVILQEGFNQKIGAFTQLIGGSELDATALTIPLLGLLPATDERVKSTITQIKEKLSANGLVYRYLTDERNPSESCGPEVRDQMSDISSQNNLAGSSPQLNDTV